MEKLARREYVLRKITSLLFVLLALTCPASYAAVKPAQDSVPALVRAHVEGMEIVKPTLLNIFKYVECFDVWDILDKSREDTLAAGNIPALIAALEEMDKVAAVAAAKVKPFVSSKNESIKVAANRIQDTYEQLIKSNKISVNQLRSFQKEPGSAESLGKIGYDIEFRISDFTSSLCHASEWVVEAINKAYPDKEKAGYPPKERAEMVKRLAAFFGEIKNKEAGIFLTEGVHFRNAVVSLYETIKQ